MSEETPERIEREMFEIRSRMADDVTDLRKHVEPHVVADQVKQTARERLQAAAARARENLKAKQREVLESGKRQLSMVREAGEQRDPSLFTNAVREDPRPLAVLGIGLAVTALAVRRISR